MYAKDTVRINHPSKGVTSSFRCQQGVKQGCPFSPLLFRLYLDALERRLDDKECDAPALANVHVWLLFFADDLVLTSELEVGLQQQLDALQQFCVERGLTVTWKKQKSWCPTLLTHAKNLCLKVTLLNVCKPSNTWGSCSKPAQTWTV
jgi:hypothetical protein